MGSGVVGGKLGSALSTYLERRFGKARTNIGGGIFTIVAAVALGIIYFISQPVIGPRDLEAVQVRVTRFNVGRSSLDIWSDDRLYTARARFWRPAVADETVQQALSAEKTVIIWVYPSDTRIFGLQAGSLMIPVESGIAEYMSNRFWFLMLWLGFLIGGLISVAYGIWLYRRENARRVAAEPAH